MAVQVQEPLLGPQAVQPLFHPIGSNQKEVECLAIRWSGAGGDKEKLVLPVVYTFTFPLAVVGSMPMMSFLLAKVVYPARKRWERHCRQKRHEVPRKTLADNGGAPNHVEQR